MQGYLGYWYRGGSTVLQNLLTDRENICSESNAFYIPTIPDSKIICKDASLYPDLTAKEPVVYRGYLGDDEYQLVHNNRIKQLTTPKIVMLVRDGRNQLSSYLYMGNRVALQERSEPAVFNNLCLGFKYRVEFIKYLVETYNTKIIKFEDMINDPLYVVSSIIEFYGGIPNKTYIQEYINEQIPAAKITLEHSSFGNIQNVNNRYKQLTSEQLDTFYQLAGPQLEYLGYL